MFYFEKLLNQGLAGIDHTSILAAVTGVAYVILLIGFLIGLYQAAMRGGDLQALGVTAIKYVVVAIVLANWATVFREVNGAATQVAHAIYSSSSGADVFLSWLDQLKTQFDTDATTSFWHLITNSQSALITVLLVLVAYLVYALAVIVFAFFYTLYGCVLYVLGPLVLAFLPMPGVGPLAKSFATNIFIWSGWGILYAIFEALITAIQGNRVNDLFTSMGFFTGGVDSTVLGLISIFYALALLLIPFIAKKIVSGDVGAAAYSMVRAAAVAAGAAVSAGAGFAAGAGAGTQAGAGAGTSAGASSEAAGGKASVSAATSSSMPPPQPSLGSTIRSAVASAVNGEAPRPAPSAAGSTSSRSQSSSGSNGGSTGIGSGKESGSRPSNQGGFGFRPIGMAQTLAYQAGRMAGSAVRSTVKAKGEESNKT